MWEFFALVGIFWVFFYMKDGLGAAIYNQRHASFSSHRGDARDVPGLDHDGLQVLTDELKQLGFVPLGDIVFNQQPDPMWKYKGPVETKTTGLARVLFHPAHGCYATLVSVHSVTTPKKGVIGKRVSATAPFRTAIISLSGFEAEFWSYTTHNRELQPILLMLRHPRAPSHRMVGASANEMLQTHLVERDSIADRANTVWDLAPTLEKYEAFEARSRRYISEVYERATAVKIAWLLLTYRFKNHDRWMGELSANDAQLGNGLKEHALK